MSLATLRSVDVTNEEISALKDWVDELGVFPRPAGKEQTAGKLGKMQRLMDFALKGTPPSVASTHSPLMQAWVNERITSGKFDAVTCEHCVNEA